jgi:hypothetical protein
MFYFSESNEKTVCNFFISIARDNPKSLFDTPYKLIDCYSHKQCFFIASQVAQHFHVFSIRILILLIMTERYWFVSENLINKLLILTFQKLTECINYKLFYE